MSVPCAIAQSQDLLAKVNGTYAFRMTPVKGFSAAAPGDPGSVVGAPRQDILRVGTFAADGKGSLKGHSIATPDTNTGGTWVVTYDWTGKYTVNADGTGFFSINGITNMVCTDTTVIHAGPTPHPVAAGGTPFAGNVTCPTGDQSVEGHEDYAFVFSTAGGRDIEFIQIDNSGGGAKIFLTGNAHNQGGLGNNQGNDDEDDKKGNGHGKD